MWLCPLAGSKRGTAIQHHRLHHAIIHRAAPHMVLSMRYAVLTHARAQRRVCHCVLPRCVQTRTLDVRSATTLLASRGYSKHYARGSGWEYDAKRVALVRLLLLKGDGGVYMDPGVLHKTTLRSWVPKAAERAGFFVFQAHGQSRLDASFVASAAGSQVITGWVAQALEALPPLAAGGGAVPDAAAMGDALGWLTEQLDRAASVDELVSELKDAIPHHDVAAPSCDGNG